MNRRSIRTAVALAFAASAASTVSAADFYWQGGTGALNAANYTSVVSDGNTPPNYTLTPNVAPTSTDDLFIGAGGSITSSGGLGFDRLRLGHNSTLAEPTANPGDGSLTRTSGTLTLVGTANGGTESGLIVGYNATGSLSITGGTLTSSFFGKIGYLDPVSGAGATGSGTVSLSNNATLTITNRGLQIGDGLPGSLTLSNTATLKISNGTTGQLAVGNSATGTFTQNGGTTTVANNAYVGRSTSANSSMTISAGTFSSATLTVADGTATNTSATFNGSSTATITGALNVGAGATTGSSLTITDSAVVSSGAIAVGTAAGATDSSITISGNAKVTGSAGFNIGSGSTTTHSSATITDNAVVNLNNGFTVGLNTDSNAVLNVGGNAMINLAVAGSTTNHFFIGRGSSVTTFNMTGGTVNSPNLVLVGTASTSAANITVNHSAGTINAGTSATSTNRGFKVGDTNGTSTYNLSGTGSINVANGLMIVGRQNSLATMNQTGGSVTASGGLHVGEAETATASLQTGTGFYNISGGTLTAAASTTDALAIAAADNGTFHVIGGDSTITVTGNMSDNYLPAEDPIPARVGTLSYSLLPSQTLTEINVSGTATFAANSNLSFALDGSAPTQSSYDLLTAADIIDNGLVFNAPSGWSYHIISGGNGEILQAFAAVTRIPGDTNGDGVVDLTDLNNVLNNFGVTASGNPGDDNGDGTVDLSDLNDVLNNFGTHSPAASGLSVVPEPATLSLFSLGALGLLTRRRRA